jgi:hypothetical protein
MGLDRLAFTALELAYIVLVHLRLGLFPYIITLLDFESSLCHRPLGPQNLGGVLGEVLHIKFLGFEPMGQLIHKIDLNADVITLNLGGE